METMVEEDTLEGIASYVHQLYKIDPGSYSFRYVAAQSGAPSFDKEKYPYINIRVLAEGMEKLTAHLYELRHSFREACEVKCKMEAEAPLCRMDYDGE